MFLKSLGACCGPNDDVKMPRGSKKPDWEVELGIVIGKTARYVPEPDALDHVAGYCVVQRRLASANTRSSAAGSGTRARAATRSARPAPGWSPRTRSPTRRTCRMWLDVNGKRMQNGNTRTMIFGVVKLVSYVSHFITLHAGDVISTGTPPGVGLGKKPEPVFLRPGDVMRLSVEGLGVQTQKVVEA